jgi:hypothetical protein
MIFDMQKWVYPDRQQENSVKNGLFFNYFDTFVQNSKTTYTFFL